MKEGWCSDMYLVLFSEEESQERTRQYNLSAYLPGYQIIGLKDWDDVQTDT